MSNLDRSSNWTAYNAAQSEEKTRFVALLSDLCSTIPQPPRPPGAGRPRLPLSDMVFASVFKVYVGFSSRRFTSDLRDAFVNGLIDTTPHFNSVSNYLSKPELMDILKDGFGFRLHAILLLVCAWRALLHRLTLPVITAA